MATDHWHNCHNRCGSELHCAEEDCAVANPWVCPTCDHIIRDEYFQALELELTQPATTHEETTHEHQSSVPKQVSKGR